MTEKINNISQIIRSTEEYSAVCDMCRDEILLYPTISGRTEYSQDEVEQITLKRIIDKLRAKEQEIEKIKNFVAGLMFDTDCINWFERFVVAFEDWKAEICKDRD